jgi:hypothetical protein
VLFSFSLLITSQPSGIILINNDVSHVRRIAGLPGMGRTFVLVLWIKKTS